MCLDSFHILSKGHNPEAIETIPADKIFFVQLADAPLLSMDVLSWSRHHRLFPGEGGFDLGAFMGHLVRTGYDGPISLEVFNDTFRQSDPLATAIAARRSLRWLENEAAGWLGASAGGRAARMSAVALPAVEPPVAVNYVELRTEATDAMRALLDQLGFRAHGPHRTKSVELWSQGAARIVLGRPESDRPLPTVAGIGLSVRDHEVALRRATELFAPQVHREESAGDEPLVGVRAPDGSEIFFGAEGDSEPGWVREFGAPSDEDHALIERVDHINLAQPWQHFDAGVLFFHSVLDLHTQPSMEVAAPVGLVRSQVLRSADGIVRIALNLVPPAADKDAILPQHIAFSASDVLAIARAARDREHIGCRERDVLGQDQHPCQRRAGPGKCIGCWRTFLGSGPGIARVVRRQVACFSVRTPRPEPLTSQAVPPVASPSAANRSNLSPAASAAAPKTEGSETSGTHGLRNRILRNQLLPKSGREIQTKMVRAF